MADDHGTLIVRSNPSGATIIVEGISKMSPAIFDLKGRVLPYNITIKKIGYDKYIKSVVISSGTKIELYAKILRFGKKENDVDNIFGKKNEERRKEIDDMKRKKDKDLEETTENVEKENNADYIDPDDLDYCEYDDIVEIIEDNEWTLMSSAGLHPITHFDTNIVHTKQCKRNSYENILEIICPPGNIITICGFNQEDIDKEEFFNSPNLYTRPHFFTLRLTEDNNNDIPCTTIIGMSRIARDGNIEKLYEEFYGDLCPAIDGRLKKKEERYYFAETIILQSGEKLVFRAYWPSIDITKIELLMMADLFVREPKRG